MSASKNCVFCTATNRLIDTIPDGDDGTTAIAKLAPDYGSALVVLSLDEAVARYENSFKSEPIEISKERWWEMLEVLPPVGWKHGAHNSESFKLSERTAGLVTAIYVRVGTRYFELSDKITLPHKQCLARVLTKFFPELTP
jgi:hypothetical protein